MALTAVAFPDAEFKYIADYIHQHFGINLTQKKDFIYSQLINDVVGSGYNGFKAYFDVAIADERVMASVLGRLTTNHTFFYRERDQFKYLTDTMVPFLLAQDPALHQIRVWSAACSSGEESYTLAIELNALLANRPSLFKILATDLSEKVLHRAKMGIYDLDQLENVPKDRMQSAFQEVGPDQFLVRDEIKSKILFKQFNLCDPFPFKHQFHIVFCRNVMIYFDEATKQDLLRKFYDVTADGGYFVAGLIGNLENRGYPFTYVKPGIYQKRLL